MCKLKKSLYGLKQASRKWYEKLSSLLLAESYTQTSADHSVFVHKTLSHTIVLMVYVDDIVLTGNDFSQINRIKVLLNQEFGIKDLGVLKFFLCLEVAHSTAGIALYQRKYCLDLLKGA